MRPHFSDELRGAIRERIERYPELRYWLSGLESEVRRFNALPIGFDMGMVFFLTDEGGIFGWEPPPDALQPVTFLSQQLVVLRHATGDFPELAGALPRRPDDAVDCAECGGRGFVDTRSLDGRVINDWPCRSCATMGWHLGEAL
jgi:hypothetical protein